MAGPRNFRRYKRQVENMLERALRPGEVVHHKDGDHTNDWEENLQVMPAAQHRALHRFDGARKVRWLTEQAQARAEYELATQQYIDYSKLMELDLRAIAYG